MNYTMNENTNIAHRKIGDDENREIFECKNLSTSTTVRILHLRSCDGSNFGAKGPCCRLNEAMKFFLDLHRFGKNSR